MNKPSLPVPVVLITGCNGLVGSFIADEFVKAGCRVRALRRPGSDLSSVASLVDRIEWVEGDVLDIPSLETALVDVEWVIHAAAIVSFAPGDQNRMYEVNVVGTANVVNACLKANVKRLCHVSSVAAIGRSVAKVSTTNGPRKEIVVNEEAKWESSPYNSHYAKTKYWAELEVWRGIAEGLNAVIVNPSVVLGAGNWYRSSARIFKYVWDEKPFYTGGTVNYVDARDVAEIIFLLTDSDVSAKRFILNAGNITYQALFNQIADCFHKRRPFLRVGRSMTKLIWRLEWIRSQLTGRAPFITRETAQSANAFFRFDNGKICRELNFRFRSIEDTVSWCCAEISEMNSK